MGTQILLLRTIITIEIKVEVYQNQPRVVRVRV